jgi:uncharacterized protein YlbG (UPF0298 family)
MKKLIIIDDLDCKNELEDFLSKHSDYVKMVVDENDVNVKVNVLMDSLIEIQKSSLKISIESSDQIRLIEVEKIVKIEKDNTGNKIYLNDGNIIASIDSFGKLEKQLKPFKIVSLNDQLILNLKYISKINLSGKKFIETEFDERIHIDDKAINLLINML